MSRLENAALAPFTTFRLGGPARFLFRASTRDHLDQALQFARDHRLPVALLGGGSNLLVSDEGYPGVVIRMELKGITFERDGSDFVVTANAGESWDDLVAQTVAHGAWGLENLSWIPGTVGAAPVQNIGAYGAEVRDCLESVRVLDPRDGGERVLTRAECRFGYRDSLFKSDAGRALIILAVRFRLPAMPRPNLSYPDLQRHFASNVVPSQAEIRQAVITIRTAKFPELTTTGTAGSFWKNPVVSREQHARLTARHPGLPCFPGPDGSVKIPLAWILDRVCGLRGHRRGPVALFERQPLILVADAGASSAAVQSFAAEVERLVEAKTGLVLQPEVGRLG